MEYVQITYPDAGKISELLYESKGNRTMKEFSEESGINQSTLSRILNKNIKRPLTMDVIQRIFDNRDSKAKFTFDELTKANGMFDYSSDPSIIKKEIIEKQECCMNSIIKVIERDIMSASEGFTSIDQDSIKCDLNIPFDFGYITDTGNKFLFKSIDHFTNDDLCLDDISMTISMVMPLILAISLGKLNDTKITFISTNFRFAFYFVDTLSRLDIKNVEDITVAIVDGINEEELAVKLIYVK